MFLNFLNSINNLFVIYEFLLTYPTSLTHITKPRDKDITFLGIVSFKPRTVQLQKFKWTSEEICVNRSAPIKRTVETDYLKFLTCCFRSSSTFDDIFPIICKNYPFIILSTGMKIVMPNCGLTFVNTTVHICKK